MQSLYIEPIYTSTVWLNAHSILNGPIYATQVLYKAKMHYFRLLLVSVVWKTLEADMRFSIYCPRTWFSDLSFRFSSLTASTRAERSVGRQIIISVSCSPKQRYIGQYKLTAEMYAYVTSIKQSITSHLPKNLDLNELYRFFKAHLI